MKAYKAYDIDGEGSTIVFAETAGQAKSIALATDTLEDTLFINARVYRLKAADCLYKGKTEIDWYDPETRLALVRDFGWTCLEPDLTMCKGCVARKYCTN